MCQTHISDGEDIGKPCVDACGDGLICLDSFCQCPTDQVEYNELCCK